MAQMLRPLGESLDGVPAASFRSAAGGRGYTLKNFGIKFVAPHELDALTSSGPQPEPLAGQQADQAEITGSSSAEQYLDRVLRATEPSADRYSDGVSEPADVSSFLRRTPDPTPWFTRYRGEFHETLRYHESELLDQPLALLVAVSTGDANPLNLVETLRAQKNLPAVFQRGVYDSASNMLRNIVVLHDKHTEVGAESEQVRERAANVFRLIKKQFGLEVLRMLEVNSLPLEQRNMKQKDIWATEVQRSVWLHTRRGGAVASSTPIVAPIGVGGDAAATAAAAPSSAAAAAPPAVAPTLAASSSSSSSSPSSPSLPVVSAAVPAGEVRGQFLSPQDLVQTSAFIGDFLLKSFLPHLERKLSVLGDKVAEKRKGFKNSFKALFGKTRDANKKSPFNGKLLTYDWHTIESQARQLADLAFVVQDYDLAGSTYRLCANDYKQDLANYRQDIGMKPTDTTPIPRIDPANPRFDAEKDRHRRVIDALTRHQAGAYEMLGLSVAMGDTASSNGVVSRAALTELATSLETAIRDYQLVGDLRRATRAAWFYADTLRWMGGAQKVGDCCTMLIRASEQRSVRAALCLEQAAYLFLHLLPTPLIRKYSFHLFRAGGLYHDSYQRMLGVRAYSAATLIYEQRAWFDIQDRLNHALGKEYSQAAMFAASVRHYVELIGKSQSVAGVKPRQTQERQRQFLGEFVEIVNNWRLDRERSLAAGIAPVNSKQQALLNAGLVPGLKLPTVLDDSIVVRTNDVGTVASCYTISAWSQALRVNPLMTLDKDQCNRPLFTPSWSSYQEGHRGCVVRESIHITFSVSNPLLIPLECSHMRLKCRWKSRPAEAGAEEVESDVGSVEGGASVPGAVFTYSTFSLPLQPLQTAVVELRVTPLQEGVLYVDGLLWDVMGALKGFHPFAMPMRQVTFPVVGGRRRKPELQPDPSLVIPITPPMPLLIAHIPSFPTHLYQGEVVATQLRLSNSGACALHKLCLRLSHPAFIAIAPQTNAASGDNSLLAASSAPACYEHTWSEGYINLNLTLQPGEHVELPLWVRGALEGSQQMGFLLKYEPTVPQPAPALKHRLAYLSFPLLVTPLLSVKVFTRPSFAHLHDSLLGIEVQDKQQIIPGITGTHEYASLAQLNVRNIDVEFGQISVLSKMWAIAPLQTSETQEAEAAAADHKLHTAAELVPRPIHSSISSPAVSSLSAPQASIPSVGNSPPLSSSAASSASTSSSSSSPVPPVHTLRPYESLVLFVRVSNLPGSFGQSATNSHGHAYVPGGSHERASTYQLHASQSANSLQQQQSQQQPSLQSLDAAQQQRGHHSSVRLPSSLAGSASAVPVLSSMCPPIAHLLRMEKALLIEGEKQTLIVNPAALLADVGASNRLDVSFAWRSSDGKRAGVYHAPGLACMKAPASACSLKVLLSYPRCVRHDFVRDGWLEVPVGVRIRNTLEDHAVTFSFETLPPEEEFDAAKRSFKHQASPALRGRYTWAGATKCKVTDLPSGECSDIPLFAEFSSAGVFNLNRFRFTVEVAGKKPRIFYFPLQHLIHVTQAHNTKQTDNATQQAEPAAVAADDTAAAAAAETEESASASSLAGPAPSASPLLRSAVSVDLSLVSADLNAPAASEDAAAPAPAADSSFAVEQHALESVEEIGNEKAEAAPEQQQEQHDNTTEQQQSQQDE